MAAGPERCESPGWSDLEEMDAAEMFNIDMEQAENRNTLRERKRRGRWCKCGGNCFPPSHPKTHMDVQCCTEFCHVTDKLVQNAQFGDAAVYRCITDHAAFKIICQYDDMAEGLRHLFTTDRNKPGANMNRKNRYTVYRLYTAWIHGKLGYQNRKPIPSCVTKAIRAKYPADNDVDYRGFEDVDPDEM